MHLIITASPNTDGLTAACGKAVVSGITSAGGTVELIDISADKLEPCRICSDGWGICSNTHKCMIKDRFTEVQEKFAKADGIILITPVYFEQPSERMKYFLDRFRRCESFNKDSSASKEKHIALIAAAGGSGHGTIPCLTEMEMWCRHVRAIPVERIGITKFNREPMLEAITDMASRLVTGEFFKWKLW